MASDKGLFESGSAPLADRMRPASLEEMAGQDSVVGPSSPLHKAIRRDDLGSIVLWGPPGSGKTTLARIIASHTRANFVPMSAVMAGLKDLREALARAEADRTAGRRTILFLDEIHRFNKAQQDALLPHVESGAIVLIGATTENPSFEVNAALLSRTRVYRLERISDEALYGVLESALKDRDKGLGRMNLQAEEGVLEALAGSSQGDARFALNVLEFMASTAGEGGKLDRALLEETIQNQALYYDKQGEEHFNLISALHKSMRNSDADATMYWLARMLEAGEDPLYLARRIVRFASEDVGLADPRALTLALAAKDAVRFVGRPESDLALAQAAVFNALAPKSNALYAGWKKVRKVIRSGATDPVPMAIRNAPTRLMKAEGYGEGYRYAHDEPGGVADLDCLPDRLRGSTFYEPTERGMEKLLSERLQALRNRKRRP
ncbi:MAG: replication-associated recombination protein A [Acidobacteria bacterium]|uniref:Replication-associated recombination protein A n=1 Tax=Candidatus Polarisedimenticola svalbardensis TaxID=2886004 RepID=A0A8J6XV52_9BACT|nr:replication-associated recombination protein A [Candidatus Polarisedimenticola svalbardensis]